MHENVHALRNALRQHRRERAGAQQRQDDQLLNLSRLHNDEVYDRSIDVQLGRLRKKIEPDGSNQRFIRTERGAGYVFTAVVEAVR